MIFISCSSKGHWQHTSMNSGSTLHSSTRLSYAPPSSSSKLQLEIMQYKGEKRGYLCSSSHPIPCLEGNPKQAFVTLKIQDEVFSYIAIRHEGGQRVLLPSTAIEKILSSLEKGEKATLEVPGAKIILLPEGFSSQKKKASFL